MTRHQARRFWILWVPTFLTGITLMATSAHLTSTTNGLTILGAIIALTGLGAAAQDNRPGVTP